mmetsp:Transcript_95487/g.273889  ORF Transcript_95487/g.273889 Transcript_95487/m.273889 type:complete len:176 (+) Transcript_95487:100-627(+)
MPRPRHLEQPQTTRGQCFYMCRFCDQWQATDKFSKDQLKAAEVQGTPSKPVAVCLACARLALQVDANRVADDDPDEEPEYASLPLESRFALVQAFTGEYEGMPAFSEDVLRRILSFVVLRPCPFVSDLGEGLFRCTACSRDFPSFVAVLQHIRTSQRHVRTLQAAAGLTGDRHAL